MALPLKIFAGSLGKQLASNICEQLKIKQGEIYLHMFPSGEHYCQYLENIRGCDVFLIQPICNPAHERLMELLVMIDAARRASAGRITVVTPYLGYLRQDRKTKSRTPITARLVADLLQTAGAQRVVGMDFHCEQAQGFFNIPVDHLYASPVFYSHLMVPTRLDRISAEFPLATFGQIEFPIQRIYPNTHINVVRHCDGTTQMMLADKPCRTTKDMYSINWAVSINSGPRGVAVEILKNRKGDSGPGTLKHFPLPIIPKEYVFRADIDGKAIDALQDYIEYCLHGVKALPIIVSPDAGGIKRASSFAESIKTDFAFISKKRLGDSEVKAYGIVGDVKGREVLIVDDMSESCGTLLEAAKVCKDHGATKVFAAVTHGLFNNTAFDRLARDRIIDELWTTDTYSCLTPVAPANRIKVLSIAPLFATAISNINQDKSITELFQVTKS